jgi:hypothetical protein
VIANDGLCCAGSPTPASFLQGFDLISGHSAVALAVKRYSSPSARGVPSACAVMDDGSVWCIGNNALGRRGTGDDVDLAAETQVAPPGTARISCTQ